MDMDILDSLEIEELLELEKKFRRIYEMEFEKFKEILRMLIEMGFHKHEDFRILIEDFKVWKKVRDTIEKKRRFY